MSQDKCVRRGGAKHRLPAGSGFVTLEKWLDEYHGLLLRPGNAEPMIVLPWPGPARAGAAMNERTGTHKSAVPIKETTDARLVFLHRARAGLILVENGLMSLDGAVSNFVVTVPCTCKRARHD